MSSEIEILQRKLNRETRARKAAELLLEEKAQELWESNQQLQKLNEKLDLQVKNRTEILVKNYNRLAAVVSSLPSAILIENEMRKVIFVNEAYCKLFDRSVLPSSFRGVACSSFAYVEKLQFQDAEQYLKFTSSTSANRRIKKGSQFTLLNGDQIVVDYIPFFNETTFIGQMWHWKTKIKNS